MMCFFFGHKWEHGTYPIVRDKVTYHCPAKICQRCHRIEVWISYLQEWVRVK